MSWACVRARFPITAARLKARAPSVKFIRNLHSLPFRWSANKNAYAQPLPNGALRQNTDSKRTLTNKYTSNQKHYTIEDRHRHRFPTSTYSDDPAARRARNDDGIKGITIYGRFSLTHSSSKNKLIGSVISFFRFSRTQISIAHCVCATGTTRTPKRPTKVLPPSERNTYDFYLFMSECVASQSHMQLVKHTCIPSFWPVCESARLRAWKFLWIIMGDEFAQFNRCTSVRFCSSLFDTVCFAAVRIVVGPWKEANVNVRMTWIMHKHFPSHCTGWSNRMYVFVRIEHERRRNNTIFRRPFQPCTSSQPCTEFNLKFWFPFCALCVLFMYLILFPPAACSLFYSLRPRQWLSDSFSAFFFFFFRGI